MNSAPGVRELLAVLAASAAVLASVALAGWVLAQDRRAGEAGATVAASESGAAAPGLALPLARDPGVLTLAQRSADVLFGLATVPGGPVEVLAVPSDLTPLPRGAFRAWVGSERVLAPTRCGRNCFRLTAPVLAGAPVSLTVEVARPSKPAATVTFELPARLPQTGAQLLRRVGQAMGALGSVRVDETLTAGTGVVIRTRYAMRSPDRIRLETSRGQKTILIGKRRWDWDGTRWVASSFPGATAPSYFWQGATRARLLGRATVGGEPAEALALFLPNRFPAWFRLLVAPDGRVLEAEMLAPGHFMTHRFSGFDEPVSIEPPTP